MKYRIGQSTDIHQIEPGDYLVLGGIRLESDKKCIAHSDGDILVHVIIEALIGAMGLGDIGTFFPDNDIKNKDRSSIEMLLEIKELLIENQYEIENIDTLIILEKPKLINHIEKIRNNLANHLQIEVNKINVKATRGEKLGFIGREEGIMAQAVALISYV